MPYLFRRSPASSGRTLSLRVLLLGACLLAAPALRPCEGRAVCAQTPAAPPPRADHLFDRGLTWDQFLAAAKSQRDAWLKTTAAAATLPPDLIERFRRVSDRLRILVVAEDWCPDSVSVVPYIARLATAGSVPLRIVDRTVGTPLLDEHRTLDGRTATPTVLLWRDVNGRDGSIDVVAWIERPAVVQQWFRSMASDPDSARRFADRQS